MRKRKKWLYIPLSVEQWTPLVTFVGYCISYVKFGYLLNVLRISASFLQICRKSDPKLNECVKNSVEKLRPYLVKGKKVKSCTNISTPTLHPLRFFWRKPKSRYKNNHPNRFLKILPESAVRWRVVIDTYLPTYMGRFIL